jgi:hypothetical protein
MADSLRSFFDRIEAPERSLVLLNRSAPKQVEGLLDKLPVDSESIETETDSDDDTILLVEDDEVIVRSALDELLESILLVNSDLYKTGTRDLEDTSLPAVLEQLDEIPFRVRGYPKSNKEKLLLITVSRVIERIAWRQDGGTLRSSFQRLSRLDDELGTRDVYRTVGETETAVHVYGVGDHIPDDLPVTVHTGTSFAYRKSWFVVFTPPESADDAEHAALVALEDDKNVWDGFWTFRPELVRDIDRYIEMEL